MRASTPPELTPRYSVELFRDEYTSVLGDPDGLVVRIVRTSIPHPTPEILEESYLQASRAMDRYGRRGRGLLVDVRNAIGRNEPAFDEALRRARARNDAGFARIAVLLRSQAGMLQLMRLSEEDGTVRLITMSEEAALAYLRHGKVPQEGRPPPGKNEFKR